ncbi:MAG: TonB-dependent siderophore receptor [Burkholderiaceae bacterium]
MNRFSPRPRPLSIALALALAGGIACAHAQGGPAAPDNASPIRIRIAAQPLAQALNDWARQTGMQLIVQQSAVDGRTAPAVSGDLTPRQALDRLLGGTGLHGRFDGNLVTVEAIGPGGATLSAVIVRDDRLVERADGPVAGYAAMRSATATKSDTPLQETPQSISIVTADQIKEMAANSLGESLDYAVGVSTAAYATSTRLDAGYGRAGSDIETFLDGVDLESGYWARSVRLEPYSLERVEVLRGPASFMYGQSSTGGVVNGVSKSPLAEPMREVGVQIGNFNRRQLQTDLTGPLTPDGRLLYRFVGVLRDSDTMIDRATDDRIFLMPSLTWKIGANTDWTVRLRYQRDRAGADSGAMPWQGTVLPNPNGRIPISLNPADPGSDHFNATQKSLGWTFEHRFDAKWRVRQNLRLSDTRVDYAAVDLRPSDDVEVSPYRDAAQRVLDRDGYFWNVHTRAMGADQYVLGEFDTGSVGHRMLAGLDFMWYRYRQLSAYDSSDAPGSLLTPIDVYAPVFNPGYAHPAYDGDATTRVNQLGIYVQDQLRWRDWRLTLGLRHDRARTTQLGETDVNTPVQNDRATTKRFGLLYLLPNGFAPYVSYAESFEPQGTSPIGEMLGPLRGKQWEAGLRYQSSDGAWRAHAAAYNLRQVNRLVQTGAFTYDQSGSVRSHGLELELIGRLTRSLSISAHYTYTDVDRELTHTPRHRAAVWAVQRFDIGGMGGFSAGAGVRLVGKYTDRSAPTTPGYGLLDLLLGWESSRWRVALNVRNVADKHYFGTCESWGICTYAARRQVTLTTTMRF